MDEIYSKAQDLYMRGILHTLQSDAFRSDNRSDRPCFPDSNPLSRPSLYAFVLSEPLIKKKLQQTTSKMDLLNKRGHIQSTEHFLLFGSV